jgi:hypothetical protein
VVASSRLRLARKFANLPSLRGFLDQKEILAHIGTICPISSDPIVSREILLLSLT